MDEKFESKQKIIDEFISKLKERSEDNFGSIDWYDIEEIYKEMFKGANYEF